MDVEAIVRNLPLYFDGLWTTVQLVTLSLACGLALAIPIALLAASGRWLLEVPARAYIYVFRGTPLLVQMYIIYYGLAQFEAVRDSLLWPVLREAYWCALLSFALNTAGYTGEILRGAIANTPHGEIEAARSVGMSRRQIYSRVILPSAFRRALPAYGNEVIFMLHGSALAGVITLVDLFGAARIVNSRHFVPFESFIAAGVFYLGLTFLIAWLFKLWERRWHAHLRDRDGDGTSSGPFQPAPASGRSPAGGRRQAALQRKVVSALVLTALLAWPGAVVRAELVPDPMIEAVQRELTERGYDPGEIDGLTGSRTQSAIREFQRSAGLADTGQIDDATLAALGLAPPGGVEPEAGADTPRDAPASAKPAAEPGPDTSGSRVPQDETAPAPDTETPEAQAPSAGPSTEPGSDTSSAEAPRSEPASERASARRLSFATLGWHPPQTGAEALARLRAIRAPPGFKRGTDALVVPKGELVFVLKAGERIPDFDCDPGAERLSIEFIFGPDGPVIFTPATGAGYCQAGIGIALTVGRTLEMRRGDWGDVQYPQGTVRITNRGLEYVR